MPTYQCLECGREFEAKRRTALCPDCLSKPLVCVVCGKEFPKKYFPYNQKTCSSKCRGVYRAQSGIAKQGAEKMKQTKIDRYGTLDPAEVAKSRSGGQLASKICPLCGKEFVPNTPRQIYCTDKHYGPCPVCGKPVEIKDYSIGPQACSDECRMARINATCLERYGNKDAVNSEHARELAKEHNLEKYGVDHYSKTDQFKEQYKNTMLDRYGVPSGLSNGELREKGYQTMLDRYGVEHYSQSEEGKEKFRKTCEERYGGYRSRVS